MMYSSVKFLEPTRIVPPEAAALEPVAEASVDAVVEAAVEAEDEVSVEAAAEAAVEAAVDPAVEAAVDDPVVLLPVPVLPQALKNEITTNSPRMRTHEPLSFISINLSVYIAELLFGCGAGCALKCGQQPIGQQRQQRDRNYAG